MLVFCEVLGVVRLSRCTTGASLVGQYPITLVHIVGFKIIKKSNQYIAGIGGDEGFKVGMDRVVYRIEV